MRRFLGTAAVAALALAVLAPAAVAKEMAVSLASGPPTLDPGEPWTAELLVHGEPDMLTRATPGIVFTSRESGETRTFDGRATGRRAADGQLLLRARVVLPEGLWEWALTDGATERLYEGGLVRVGEPAAAPAPPAAPAGPAPAAAPDDASTPWGLVGAGAVLFLIAVAGALAVRQRRVQPSA